MTIIDFNKECNSSNHVYLKILPYSIKCYYGFIFCPIREMENEINERFQKI